jgi:hypothetical protein
MEKFQTPNYDLTTNGKTDFLRMNSLASAATAASSQPGQPHSIPLPSSSSVLQNHQVHPSQPQQQQQHATLGQIADQFQERARVLARASYSAPESSGRGGVGPGPGSGGNMLSHRTSTSSSEADDHLLASDLLLLHGGMTGGGGDGGDDDDDGGDDQHDENGGHESTGRWTKQEHELFLQALKKYGKVSSLVFSFLFLSI